MTRMTKAAALTIAAAAFFLTPPPAADAVTITGDANLNGTVTGADLVVLQDYLLGAVAFTEPAYLNADCTVDGKVDAFDLCVLKKMLYTAPAGMEEKGVVHTGYATYYGGGYEGGCAMLDPISMDDYWITAMNIVDYDNARLAGAYLEVTGELGTINVLVTDLLPEGQKGDLDLYVDAFPLIAPAEKGKVPISWKIIPLDTAENAPVSYKYKEGTTEFWCGVQVRNHRYPIEKLEYLDENGEFVELPRRHYNYFESDSMGAGPFTFRITDIYGQVIVDENIPLTPDEIQEGHVQFPE